MKWRSATFFCLTGTDNFWFVLPVTTYASGPPITKHVLCFHCMLQISCRRMFVASDHLCRITQLYIFVNNFFLNTGPKTIFFWAPTFKWVRMFCAVRPPVCILCVVSLLFHLQLFIKSCVETGEYFFCSHPIALHVFGGSTGNWYLNPSPSSVRTFVWQPVLLRTADWA